LDSAATADHLPIAASGIATVRGDFGAPGGGDGAPRGAKSLDLART
jgi:hypothetical protein